MLRERLPRFIAYRRATSHPCLTVWRLFWTTFAPRFTSSKRCDPWPQKTEDAGVALIRCFGALSHASPPPPGCGSVACYVLNPTLWPMAAQLHFCQGIGVARGYNKRPGLTAEKFIADPYSGKDGSCMYRSGDIGRWLENGEVYYVGRKDSQVVRHAFAGRTQCERKRGQTRGSGNAGHP